MEPAGIRFNPAKRVVTGNQKNDKVKPANCPGGARRKSGKN